ncbi:hypothetical protein CBS101457_003782 [Exobasidium rhododendri]|nr:hypothetical protein CBS101457_003782 [Exobasidium rhododendri]
MEGEGVEAGHHRHEKLLHYLGPPGTYSHQVALDLANRLAKDASSAVLQPCSSINATLEQANERTAMTGRNSWALLPFENNSNGPVADSYDILFAMSSSFRVVEEYYLPVSHSLLCNKGVYLHLCGGDLEAVPDLSKLDAVSSHPQALGQCSTFIDSVLRNDVMQLSTSSTGGAAKALMLLQQNADPIATPAKLEACISSRICAQADVYDLITLRDKIQNSSKNVTRFLLLEVMADGNKSKTLEARDGYTITDQMRMMLHLKTTTASDALTYLMAAVTSCTGDAVRCHVRYIERRAIKDAVDHIDDMKAEDDGHWPFVYLVELEGRGVGLQSQIEQNALHRGLAEEASAGNALSSVFIQTLEKVKSEGQSTLTCLGLWSVHRGKP